MASPENDKRRILVVNSNATLRELMRVFLEKENYEIIIKKSVVEAIEYVKSENALSVTIAYHCEDSINGSEFLQQISILSPNTIRYLTNCCLPHNTLERHIKNGIIQLHSKLPFSLNEIKLNVALAIKIYDKGIGNI
jgi:response regulator RpfG family c-di-GMP phosphodiesterase